jgi:hypothetical protein
MALLTSSEALFAAAPGKAELSDLRSAARGDLSKVFVVRMFSGWVAFPHTTIQLQARGNTTEYRVHFHRDASLTEHGAIVRGMFLTSIAGREDADSRELLPSDPSSTEQIGAISVEYFENLGQVILTHNHEYLQFFGSATVIAREVALTAKALSGPPDMVMRHQEPEKDLSPAGRFETCSAKVLQVAVLFHGKSEPIRYRVMSGSDPRLLTFLGLEPDDMIVCGRCNPRFSLASDCHLA